MKAITIILTFDQARYLLNNLPSGTAVKMSVETANRIVDSEPSTNKVNKSNKH
jgi:hypothetical protein